MPWPGNSPDMNPIEHVWDFIGNKIQDCMFQNMDELFERVKAEWNKIPLQYISNLYESMRMSVSALIKAKARRKYPLLSVNYVSNIVIERNFS